MSMSEEEVGPWRDFTTSPIYKQIIDQLDRQYKLAHEELIAEVREGNNRGADQKVGKIDTCKTLSQWLENKKKEAQDALRATHVSQ